MSLTWRSPPAHQTVVALQLKYTMLRFLSCDTTLWHVLYQYLPFLGHEPKIKPKGKCAGAVEYLDIGIQPHTTAWVRIREIARVSLD